MSKPMQTRDSIAYMRELAKRLEDLCRVPLGVGYTRGTFILASTEGAVRVICVSNQRDAMVKVLQTMIRLQEVACRF